MVGTADGVVAVARFPPELPSAGKARQLVRSSFAELAPEEVVEVAVLLASELVTNAVVHGRSPVNVVLSATVGALRVAVTDESDRLPVVQPLRTPSEGGLGMILVERMSNEWGVQPTDRGKTVWFGLLRTCSPTAGWAQNRRRRQAINWVVVSLRLQMDGR